MPPWTLPKVHASGPLPPEPTPIPPQPPATGPTSPAPGGRSGPGGPAPGPDWAAQTADRIDQLVGTIRSSTTDRLVKVARWIVLGLLAAIMAIAAGILITIALVRVLDEMVPGNVWVVYSGLGAIFTAAGVLLWSKRTPRHSQA